MAGGHGGSGIAFLSELGVTLFAALVGGMVARSVHIPVLIGYLLAGIAVGPHTPGFIADQATVSAVSDLGVTLLMFMVGVHFSLRELSTVFATAVYGGAAQIVGTILLGLAIGTGLGWDLYGSLYLGCAISLSSTAVMMKILEERGELGTTHGVLMLGILVVQDLSLILMMTVLPALASLEADGAGAFSYIGLALFKAALFVSTVVLVSVRIVPMLLDRVARTGSHELFLLSVVCLCILTALGAELMGLGMPLGAFMAGLVISESPYSSEVFSQVRPLRDLFASLFFVSVGMLLDLGFIAENYLTVLVVVSAIVVGKGALSSIAVYVAGWHGKTALLVGLGLAQIGEFSFVLATVGSSRGLIPAEIGNVILSSALVTILITPFLFGAANYVYAALNTIPALSRLLNRQMHELPPSSDASPPQVVILGGGRVGRYFSDALRAKGVSHSVVDYEPETIARLQDAGVPVLYGDASSAAVLEQLSLTNARLALVTLPDAHTTEVVVKELRRRSASLGIIARVHRGDDIPIIRRAGADVIIHAEFEAGVEVIRYGLDMLGFGDGEVDKYVDEVRMYRYREDDWRKPEEALRA